MLMRSKAGPSPDWPEPTARGSLAARSRFRQILTVYIVLVVPMISYVGALTYPGQASLSVRSVEWVRDNGGGPLVNNVENWWYTRHAPPTTAPDPLPPRAVPTGPPAPGTPAPLPALGPHLAPGEGAWVPGPTVTHGVPAMFSTYVRPDPRHPGVVAGIARFDQRLVTARLIAGTKEPDRHSWPEGGQVPPQLRAGLVATFNSGFKMSGAKGGFYADDRMARKLRTGSASLVIDRNGVVSVGEWGRDVHFGPDIAAVRQNLALIVDNAKPVPGLEVNADDRWGSARNQLQYTWRSAAGVDAAGNLYYIAGEQLTLATLATALAATGAVHGMELDIHPHTVHLFAYQYIPTRPDPSATALLTTMIGPDDRYLTPDQRDFFALTLR